MTPSSPSGLSTSTVAASSQTVAVISAGALGVALGVALKEKGFVLTTCLCGRSPRTGAAAIAAGMQVFESLEEALIPAHFVLSVVPPDQALPVAIEIVSAADATGVRPILVDCNSISASTIRRIEGACVDTNLLFADVAFRGGADRLGSLAQAYVSGRAADEVAEMLGLILPVEQLGPEAGRASGLKMALAGVAKGIPALVLESAAVAYREGQLERFLVDVERFYPGVFAALERTAPSYAAAAARRAFELGEAVGESESQGLDPLIARAVAAHLERVGRASLGHPSDARELIVAFASLHDGVVVEDRHAVRKER